MKARIKATGEIVNVYYETQHGTAMTAIYKEATLVNGRTFTDKDIEIMNESQLEEHIIGKMSVKGLLLLLCKES